MGNQLRKRRTRKSLLCSTAAARPNPDAMAGGSIREVPPPMRVVVAGGGPGGEVCARSALRSVLLGCRRLCRLCRRLVDPLHGPLRAPADVDVQPVVEVERRERRARLELLAEA